MLTKIKFLTAGESHGQGLLGILDGIPSGLKIEKDFIDRQLTRRQMGYGRGGRMKIEKRPFLAIYWENNYDRVSSIFLQQAETVRVICQDGEVKSVTELSKGDSILCHQSNHTRHIGN